MRLGLSSEAAPDAGVDELIRAATRHGLPALELRAGDGHGVSCDRAAVPHAIADVAARAAAAGIGIVGYRCTGAEDDAALATLATALRTTVIVDGDDDAEARATRAARLLAAGTDAAVLLRGGTVVDDARRLSREGISVVWEANPADATLGGVARALLEEFPAALHHVRFLGGGPETVMHEGRGIGELMGRLALAGFGGTVVLAPSSPRYRVAWSTWLGRHGGSGCGSKVSDRSLVALSAPSAAGSAS